MTKPGFFLETMLNRFFDNNSVPTSKNKRKSGRICRIEELESREMLSVSTAEFATIKSQYEDLNLTNYADYNIIEITADKLSDAQNLFDAISDAGETTQNDLIVLRTTATHNTILLSGNELAIDINATSWGSVTIVSLGDEKLTIDANKSSRVLSIGIGSTVALAGLIITGGDATKSSSGSGHGGGICSEGTLTITKCKISDNYASSGLTLGDGGGIYSSGALTIIDCLVSRNTANNRGGGLYTGNNTSVTITGSHILYNDAGGAGGGIYHSSGTLVVTNVEISGNSSSGGGGIYSGGTLTATGCTILNNAANGIGANGGGISGNRFTITNSEILENTASSGGGIYNSNSGFGSIEDCIISKNTATLYQGGGISGANLTITNCKISENHGTGASTSGGGIYHGGGTSMITDCDIVNNATTGSGGGIHQGGSDNTLTITNCTISDNTARNGGGIGSWGLRTTLTVTHSTIAGNSANIAGGGIYFNGNPTAIIMTVINCLISGNKATSGGGVYNASGRTDDIITNCTIAGNMASTGGGIYTINGKLTVNNTIVAKNFAQDSTDIHENPGTIAGRSNLVGDGIGQNTLVSGFNGNLVGTTANPIDPKFVTFASYMAWTNKLWERWDLRLAFGSPAVDNGNNALAIDGDGNPLATDRAGIARIINGTVDMGAYEGTYEAVPLLAELDIEWLAKSWLSTNKQSVKENYENGVEIRVMDAADEWTGYVVNEVFTNDLGLYAVGLVNEIYGEAILVFEGTQDFVDFASDVDPRGVGYSQYFGYHFYEPPSRKDILGWADAQLSAGKNVHATGHSLGGALAQWFAVDWTYNKNGTLRTLETFNSPGISEVWAKNFVARGCTVTHHVVIGDFVSLAGLTFISGNVRIYTVDVNPLEIVKLQLHTALLSKHGHYYGTITAATFSRLSYHYPGLPLLNRAQAEGIRTINPVLIQLGNVMAVIETVNENPVVKGIKWVWGKTIGNLFGSENALAPIAFSDENEVGEYLMVLEFDGTPNNDHTVLSFLSNDSSDECIIEEIEELRNNSLRAYYVKAPLSEIQQWNFEAIANLIKVSLYDINDPVPPLGLETLSISKENDTLFFGIDSGTTTPDAVITVYLENSTGGFLDDFVYTTTLDELQANGWTPENVPNGTYYVYIHVECGDALPEMVYFQDAITIGAVPPDTPPITAHPQSATYTQGDTAAPLTITASGNGGLSYQWYKDGEAITGETSNFYEPSTDTVGSTGYYCIVTNTLNGISETAQSNTAMITVNAPLPVADTPTFSVHPQSATYTQGDTAVALTITANGNGTLSYQWYKDGVAISDATLQTYTPSIDTVGSVEYYCIVSNMLNGATKTAQSNTATITTELAIVLPPTTPTFTGANQMSTGNMLEWNAVSGVAWYKLEVSTNGTNWVQLGGMITGTSYQHVSLDSYTAYHYRVSAVNSGGSSTPSSVTKLLPRGTGVAAAKAGGVKKTNVSISSTTISWKPDGKSRNTFYEVVCTSHYGVNIGAVETINGRHTVMVTGLNPGTKYKFAIISYNGDTVATNKKGKVTSVANVSMKTKNYAAVKSFKAPKAARTTDSLMLTWKASPFPETDRYEVICYDSKGKTVVYPADDPNIVYDGCKATISGLGSNTKYKFEIRAVSDMLGGLKSQVAKVSAKTKK